MFYDISVFLISTIIGILFGKFLIPFLIKLKFGQTIREEGPESHKKKTGTPTMGGIIFFLVFLFGGIVFGDNKKELWFMILFAMSFGVVGFIDDYLIILRKDIIRIEIKIKISDIWPKI